jgi:hypothetical protein
MPTRPETAEPAAPAPAPPRLVDRYEIVGVIARGGGGTAVYRALDTRLGRAVALKTATGAREGARLTDRVRQRFLREAMALSKVDQRNVVQVLDYGFADDGAPFLVMEHLRGRDLGALLALAGGPLPVPDVADIGLGVCAALRACHRVGIIHRDLKAPDVFLVDTDTGVEIKVLDFGVSVAAASDDRTREARLPTPSHHLAPEQIDGKVGPASDQYALGVLLRSCLTGRPPQPPRGGRAAAPRGGLPAALEAILRRATQLAPGERFESVYAFGRELLEFASPRGQAQWRGYYDPQRRPRSPWADTPLDTRPRAGGAGTGTTSVDVARAVTETKVSRGPGREARGEGATQRRPGAWPLRAASIGCVALAASGLASGRRRPPRAAPPPSSARGESAPVHRPAPAAPHGARPREPPRAPHRAPPPAPAAPPVTAALMPVSLDAPPGGPPAPARRRAAPPAAAAPRPAGELRPVIDPAGIGIPTE